MTGKMILIPVACLAIGASATLVFTSSAEVGAGCPGIPGTPCGNGDVNGDGKIDIGDAVYLLSYLFGGGPVPVPVPGVAVCEEHLARCQDDLQAHETQVLALEAQLTACQSTWTECHGALTQCASDLDARNVQVAALTNQLAASEAARQALLNELAICQGILGDCESAAAQCYTSLLACQSSLAAAEALHMECESDLTQTRSDLEAREAEVAALQNELVVCQAALKECPPPSRGPLPATGQTICCDTNGQRIDCSSADWPGQDGFYRTGCPTEGRFIDNGDETVTDLCTGLMWQKSTTRVGFTWQNALQYCESLEFAGYTDWRLPNVHELHSLVDYGRSSPAMDPVFEGILSWCWSSSTYHPNWRYVWLVYSYNGDVNIYLKTEVFFLRAVRG